MSKWVRVANAEEIPAGQRKLCEVEGKRLAVFRHAGEWIAIDNHCPHRGGPIGAGALVGDELTCPWHGWRFNLTTGACAHESPAPLTRFPVEVREDGVYVDLDPSVADSANKKSDGIFRYLVRYGAHGFVGRFGSVHKLECRRGDRVLIHTDRGQELGEVLAAPEGESTAGAQRPPAGEVVRVATKSDLATATKSNERPDRVLERARTLAAEKQLLVTLVDAEELLDGVSLVVYYLGTPSEKLGPMAVGLGQWLGGCHVRFQQLEANSAGETVADESPFLAGAGPMRGPAERLKYDLRRLWECPACRHRERSGGDTSSMLCPCQEPVEPTKRQWMKLLEDGPRRNPDPKPVVVKQIVAPPLENAEEAPPAGAPDAGPPAPVAEVKPELAPQSPPVPPAEPKAEEGKPALGESGPQ